MPSADYSFAYFNVNFPHEFVAHVEINRPEKLNAFKEPLWSNLCKIFNRLSRDENVRCVVLSGSGEKAFTAGLDVQESGLSSPSQQRSDPARTATLMRRHILDYQECVTAIERCEKPVIVVLHGYSFGLAIDISSSADIRICAEGTKFCVKETDIGLAADVGTLTRLPKLGVPLTWVKEICYTSRVFGPEEALRVGFVSEVCKTKGEALDRACAVAREIAGKSPVAVQGTKALVDWSRDRSVADGLMYTAVWNAAMLQTDDVKKAMLSGLKRTKTSFEKL